jgi:hypothetical protein
MKDPVQTDVTPSKGEPESSVPTDDQVIRHLAYELWLARGCPIGSAETDWFAAKKQLENPSQVATAP